MYSSKYDSEYGDEVRFGKKTLLWIIGLVITLSIGGWLIARPAKIAEKVIDDSLVNYEEFQAIYNTCKQLNTDIATIRAVDDHDPMFAQFSKSAQIAAKKQSISRWVEEYNGKSKMWNRSMWKSDKLPYQLSTADFPNFEGAK